MAVTGNVDGRTTRRRSGRTGGPTAEDTDELRQRFMRAQERRGLAWSTVKVRDNKLRLVAEHMHPVSLLDATERDIEEFLDRRALTPRARYAWVSNLHMFYDWCLREDLIGADPTARIDRPRSPRVVPRPIADDDLEYSITQASPSMAAMLTLGAYAGLRCQEIAGLQVEDLITANDPPVIVVTQGKGGHQRVVPMHQRIREALNRFGMPKAGYLFTDPMARPWPAWRVSQSISAYFRDIGVDATAHQLRHWFGTNVYRQSKDLRVTQHLLGHASPNTTTIYVAWSAEDAERAVEAL